MHRGYTAERYLERLRAARAGIPELAVTTDLIVGFPGETEEDFAATLEVVAEAGYDAAYTFVFSPRPGTEAAAWVDEFIPQEVSSKWWDVRRWLATKPGSGGSRRSSSRGRPRRIRR
jgi:tRNA-2-methylthio-N6-dimethylallyladenosine synthase